MNTTAEQNTYPTVSEIAVPTNIVVATDLADLDVLLPHAIVEANAANATITLVHAVPVIDEKIFGEQARRRAADEALRATQTLREVAHSVQQKGIRCDVVSRCGYASDVIKDIVAGSRASRLIVGAHSHGYDGPFMIGHVTNSLLKEIHIPILVIGPQSTANFGALPQRILHPVSLHNECVNSVEVAVAIARTYKATLTLVHVLPSEVLRGSYVEEQMHSAQRKLQELLRNIGGTASVRTIVTCGELVSEIHRVCAQTHSDWIVIGIRKDFPWWSKSNNAAYQVIARSTCPVLTVRHSFMPDKF